MVTVKFFIYASGVADDKLYECAIFVSARIVLVDHSEDQGRAQRMAIPENCLAIESEARPQIVSQRCDRQMQQKVQDSAEQSPRTRLGHSVADLG